MSEISMAISVPTDGDGFLRRECPNCERQFKWWVNDTSRADAPDAITSTESYFCPYCYEVADSDSWWTTEQLDYVQERVAAEIVSPSVQRLKRDIETINSSNSLVKMTVTSPKLSYPEPLAGPNDMVRLDFPCHPEEPIKVVESWEHDACCLICGIRYPVDTGTSALRRRRVTADNAIGPESLPQFEDRVLYHLVNLLGDQPVGLGKGISEADLAVKMADDLGISPDFPRTNKFHSSNARGIMLEAVKTLEDEGLADATKMMGPWTVRPTRSGRQRVNEWRDKWESQQQTQDREIQRRILASLNQQRQANPQYHQFNARVDVDQLCSELGVNREVYLANAYRLRDQGKISMHSLDQHTLEGGYAFITEAGIRALESHYAASRPMRDAQEAWVEVARLRRQLQLAQRTLPSLIQDDELRRRCEDLLVAEGRYDRVIREACVILENRIRAASSADASLIGVALMQQAFSPKNGMLQLSEHPQEQQGAMELYCGTMRFFRNSAGHSVIDTYTQDDALRFVAWIDLLLSMVEKTTEHPDS